MLVQVPQQCIKVCATDGHAIAWADLLFTEAQALRRGLDESTYYTKQPSDESGRACVAEFVVMSERLRRVLLVCGRWGTSKARSEVANALIALATPKPNASGFTFWHALRNIPATLCFYWYCIGALASANYPAVKRMFGVKIKGKQTRDSLLDSMPPMTYESVGEMKFLNGETTWKLPASHYIAPILNAEIGDVARTPEEGDVLFDTLETLISLESAHLRLAQLKAEDGLWFWVPMGKFVWRRDGTGGLSDFEGLAEDNEYLEAGFFGGNLDGANAAVVAVKDHIRKTNLNW